MAATCSNFQLNSLDTTVTSILSSMSTDGQTIFIVDGNFIAPQFVTNIKWRKSVNGGQSFPSSGGVVDITDGFSLGWDISSGSLSPQALVCNSTGTQQTLFFYYYVPTNALAGQRLYARTSTDGGVTWGSIVAVSDSVFTIDNVSAHMATAGMNDGAIVDVIWSQQAATGADPTHTFIARSNDNASNFVKDEIDPKQPDAASQFPHITGSTDGSIGWATMVYYGRVIAFTRVGIASYIVSPAPSYTTSQVNSNVPRISCSGNAQTIAISYLVGGPITDLNRSWPLWCVTSDDNGASWFEKEMTLPSESWSSRVTVGWDNVNLKIADPGHDVVVSGNSLNSGNSCMIYVAFIAPSGDGTDMSKKYQAQQVRSKIRYLTYGWVDFSPIVGTTDSPLTEVPLQKVQIVTSYNGAIASSVWSDSVNANNDRPVKYIRNLQGGIYSEWSSPVDLNSVSDSHRQPIHPLLCSVLGNVTSVVFGNSTNETMPVAFYNTATWTRRCDVASSNNLTVTRTFDPNQNTWDAQYQQVIYTFSIPAFATADFKLNTFLDKDIMESATSSGPVKDGTVSIDFVGGFGLHLGTFSQGVATQVMSDLQVQTFGGATSWVCSTGEIPSGITANVTFSTKSGVGTTDFFSGLPPWDNGTQWSLVNSPLVTYIGATPGIISSTQNLLVSDVICVAEGCRVKLANSNESLQIEKLRPGGRVLGENNQCVSIVKLIKLDIPLTNFIQLQKGDDDSGTLLICRDHPILIDGREIMPQEIGQEVSLSKPKSVYTLITSGRQFVQMEGFLVGTWSQLSWDNFLNNDPRAKQLKFTEIIQD